MDFGLSAIAELISISRDVAKEARSWWVYSRPIKKVLEGAGDDGQLVRIFVRDMFLNPGTSLYVREGAKGPVGTVPNVLELWPRVEGQAFGNVLNVLGRADKTRNIAVVEMGNDTGLWDSHLIVLGAQAQKCFDFYNRMTNVAYRMDATEIYDRDTGNVIPRAGGFGYGIILKSRNPFIPGGRGIGFLIGGYGVLGTEAAGYYFGQNLDILGRLFGRSCFGVVVRAPMGAGVQAITRLIEFDKKME